MADPGFPGQHTTATSVTQTVSAIVRYDPSYIRTVPGIIKCAIVILNLIGFICIIAVSPGHYSRGSYFNTVAMGGFWFTGIMLLFYIFHVCEKFWKVPWLKIEFVFNVIWVILYVFAASFAAATQLEAYQAAAFFGFLAMCLYGYDAFLKYTSYRNGEVAQATRSVQRSNITTVTA